MRRQLVCWTSKIKSFHIQSIYIIFPMAPPQALQKYKSKDIKMDPLYAKGMIKNMIKDFSLRFSLKNQWYLRCPECSDWYVKVNYTVECWTVMHSIYNLHSLTLSEKKVQETSQLSVISTYVSEESYVHKTVKETWNQNLNIDFSRWYNMTGNFYVLLCLFMHSNIIKQECIVDT